MVVMKECVTIKWETIRKKEFLKFTFTGTLSHHDAAKASGTWAEIFRDRSTLKMNVIFNCTDMKDYDPFARITWQKTISDLKGQINEIWVISDSKIIRAGAAIMGMFTSFNLRTVNSEDKISVD